MKLQVALDTLTLDECVHLLEEIREDTDIAEVGTPFIIEEGMRPVRELKKRFPELEILADAKIMDAGEYEAEKCFSAGADIVTVLGAANDATIEGVVRAAKRYGKKVMADMIEVSDLEKRAGEIDGLGVDYICVHTAWDVQNTGKNPLDDLITVNKVLKKAKSAVAGGVKLSTAEPIAKEHPSVVVVGGGIIQAQNRKETAGKIKEILRREVSCE
ncbi:MAG: 3-hexulose-6-phosphate synthase [Erysipelotrichales bacterium]|nr:3-hexulose-6-phosphate synthase [Erysipelotrichales bacterium]